MSIELSRRLERAEGHACAMFAEAHGTEWIECAGTYAVFNGPDSPVTQTFGLGLFEDLNAQTLDTIEKFFFDRKASVAHEVSPFAGVAALNLLCDRGYRPIEISNVMVRETGRSSANTPKEIRVRVAEPNESQLWADTLKRGWLHEFPDLEEFFNENGAISAATKDSVRFIAELEGKPGAAGALNIHNGVALLGGASTVPEMRRRGLQTALIETRMKYAEEHGCDLLMLVAEPGSKSQRNAERNGFRVAYTRTKWNLSAFIGVDRRPIPSTQA